MWIIEVTGERHVLQALDSNQIEGSPLQEVDGVYRLDPACFEGLQGPAEAKHIGETILASLRMHQILLMLPKGRIGLGNLREVVEGQHTTHHVAIVESLIVSASLVSFQIGDDPIAYAKQPRGPTFDQLEAVFREEKVGVPLQNYLSQSLDDWTNLARIIELIKHAAGGPKALEARGWVSQKNLKHFDHTANHPSSGPTARHSADRHLPPDAPMTLIDGKELALSLARNWILDQTKPVGDI
ncbi:hypothetical protein [Xanthomonas hortorum]|uniref:hypothetical protein n=1 Tax=Xanthomonas hortorum TaxID=56454 RepID=UPI001F38CA6C|nr:hypothetical protein [Xanthomonas hortorum]MCE4517985.1 hypothetical protein [Xanthomonas hortorum pv. vitians]